MFEDYSEIYYKQENSDKIIEKYKKVKDIPIQYYIANSGARI